MSEFEYDPFEYAEALAEGEGLGGSDLDEARRSAEDEDRRGLSRRDLLVRGGLGAAAVGGLGALAGPAAAKPAASGKFTGTLRVLTLGVEFPIPDIAKQASKDLGFTIKPILAPSEKQPQIAITSPDTFDVFGGYNYQSLQVWPSGGLQPVDTHRLASWNSQYKLFTHGKLNPASARCTFGQGNAPFRTTFVDPNGSTGLPAYASGPPSNKQIVRWIGENGKPIAGKPQPRWIVGPAAHFNADSMGYNADVIKKRPEQVSWAELLNTKWKGRVSLLRDPGIMSQDAAAAVGALGLLKIKDYGNPTKAEIDRLFKILTTYKKTGPVPRVLVGLHRLGELHGLEGGRDRVDVVARRGARQGGRREHPLRRPARGLPRLVQRRGHLLEGHGPGEAPGLLRLHQLELQRVPRRRHHAPGLLHRQRAEAAPVDQFGRGEEGRLHACRVRLLVGRQGGPA